MRSERLIVPDQVTESVSLCPLTNYEERRSASYVDFVTMKRYNEEVRMAPCLTPVAYRDTVVCFPDSHKKRFKSQTLYEPKVKPRKFRDTMFIFPKRPQKSYVTCLDYHIDECRRWFKTTLEFKARTYTTSKIPNEKEGADTSDSETSEDEDRKENIYVKDGPGASQVFLPRWNKERFDENKNVSRMMNGDLLLNGF